MDWIVIVIIMKIISVWMEKLINPWGFEIEVIGNRAWKLIVELDILFKYSMST